jgi:hypothetical protein
VMFDRWKRYRDYADERVRARLAREAQQLRLGYTAALWAMERFIGENNPLVSQRIRELRLEMERELRGAASAFSRTAGPLLLWSARREARLHPGGCRIEPRTFVDRPA